MAQSKKLKRIKCPHCGSFNTGKNGISPHIDGERQKIHCYTCKRHSALRSADIVWGFLEDSSSVGENGEIKEVLVSTKIKTKMGINENELRAKHDVRYQVSKAVETLKPSVYLTDSEFINNAKIKAGAGYRDILSHPDFETYHGKAGSIIYWSHPDSIGKLKEEGVLL